MAGSAIRSSHLADDDRVQDPYCLRCQPQVMGAVLDLLRHAAATLETEANGVSDNPLIFPETGEALSGGNFHAEPVAFAADQIAIALCEIGSLAERRIAMLVDPALSGLPAFLSPRSGLNSGFMIPQVTAAALVAENKKRAFPASVDSHPDLGQPGGPRVDGGPRRPSAAADGRERSARVVGIELLAAAQGCDFLAPLSSSPPLEPCAPPVRGVVPHLEDDRLFAPDIEVGIRLVRRGLRGRRSTYPSSARRDRDVDGDPRPDREPGHGESVRTGVARRTAYHRTPTCRPVLTTAASARPWLAAPTDQPARPVSVRFSAGLTVHEAARSLRVFTTDIFTAARTRWSSSNEPLAPGRAPLTVGGCSGPLQCSPPSARTARETSTGASSAARFGFHHRIPASFSGHAGS